MNTELPVKNCHGVTIRSEHHPLSIGDSFELFSKQVYGMYRGYPHFALPGRYTIVSVSGRNLDRLEIVRPDHTDDVFSCNADQLPAMLGEWSDYQLAGK